jgi:signal recognition particle subunit SRP54
MAFERLSGALTEALKKLTKTDRINEGHLDALLREVKLALLEADVHTAAVDAFLAGIRSRALGEKIFGSVKPDEALMKIVYDRLVDLLGSTETAFDYAPGQFTVMMVVGLQGTGKTTSVAKLAHLLTAKGRHPYLIAADLQRPAAIDQLEILGTQIGVAVYADRSTRNPVAVVKAGLAAAKAAACDTVIIDTAGRLAIDDALMAELVDIQSTVKPHEILLSVDALAGQDALTVSAGFASALKLSGLIVSKFDGESKGGAVLSAKTVTNVPIKLVGTGEKVTDYDLFHADRMANRLIGMGDLLSLVESAQAKLDQATMERSAQRLLEGQFSFDDLLHQFDQMAKMGSMKAMLGMLPGMSQLASQVNDAQANEAMKKNKAIILSMTLEERDDASLLRASRKARIAAGSGTSVSDVNRLIAQYEKAKEQVRMMARMAKRK